MQLWVKNTWTITHICTLPSKYIIPFAQRWHFIYPAFVTSNQWQWAPPARPISPSSKSTRLSNARIAKKAFQRFIGIACAGVLQDIFSAWAPWARRACDKANWRQKLWASLGGVHTLSEDCGQSSFALYTFLIFLTIKTPQSLLVFTLASTPQVTCYDCECVPWACQESLLLWQAWQPRSQEFTVLWNEHRNKVFANSTSLSLLSSSLSLHLLLQDAWHIPGYLQPEQNRPRKAA